MYGSPRLLCLQMQVLLLILLLHIALWPQVEPLQDNRGFPFGFAINNNNNNNNLNCMVVQLL